MLPGTFPDSVPATPDEPRQHSNPAEQHRQHTKPRKPGGPRGHNYTDSGVGLTNSELIQSARPVESKSTGPEEAVGGGTYTRDRTETGTASRAQHANDDIKIDTNKTERPDPDLSEGMADPARPANAETIDRSKQSSPKSAPYWGDLPSQEGKGVGVYNSVAGHGSPLDDHAQHHHLRPKSKSPDRAVIVGHVGDYPRGGGVYNTVVGHGSQDEEAKRHGRSTRGSTDKAGKTAANAGLPDDMMGAPLPNIPEEQQRNNGHTTTFSKNTQDIAPGFLPELAVRDDVRLLTEAKARDAERTQSPPKHDTSPQRAFPLAQKHDDGVGAAGVGAGINAGQDLGDRREDSARLNHRGQGDGETGPSTARERRRSLGGHTPDNRRRSRQRSPTEKTGSHGDDSPSKHKIFGIFHRHKDNGKDDTTEHRRKSTGDRAEPTKEGRVAGHSPNRLQKHSRGGSITERKRSLSRSKADADKHTSIGNDKAAAEAAAGAGAFGLFHRRKNSVSEKPRDTTGSSRAPLSADAGGVGLAGEAPRQLEQVSTPFEHPREAPLPPWSGSEPVAGAAGEQHQYNTFPSGTPSGVQHAKAVPSANEGSVTKEPGHYKTLDSGTPSGVAVASAPKPGRKDVMSHEPTDYNVLASSGGPKTDATRKDVVASESGDYNVLKSSGSAPAAGQDDVEDTAEYNVLPSGTPSGVKVKPKSTHHGDHDANDQISRGQHNPRLADDQPPSLPPVDITSHPQTLKDLAAPATASKSSAAQGSIPANPTYPHPEMAQHMSPEFMPDSYRAQAQAPSHYQSQPQPQPQPQDQPATRNMSREVMPEAYTASAPGHTRMPQNDRQPQLRGGDANESNEKSFGDNRIQDGPHHREGQTQRNRDRNADSGKNAALAAATSSWAPGSITGAPHSALGKDVGGVRGVGAQGGRVVHVCEHCGRENDITRYFSGQAGQ
ncbi:hypothetical protein C8A03DRAFT_19307 [Achaetomium macrosporum]|uniref:Uncharacterized protein n=1 Tax=Achaetomium macrosporum TaxID=79813 RepID=A0AAN7C245_9PEZI|nr:hypothetical protein C8A03DRAFT_19307 [Achaetomium macrosporum]